MGLTAQAAAAAAAGFDAAGDALKLVTLRLGPTEGAYDADTDTQTLTWEQESAGVQCLQYSDKSIRDNVNQQANFERKTQSFLFLGTAVTAGRPDQSGEIVDADGITWKIAVVDTDPTNAVWIFHCTT